LKTAALVGLPPEQALGDQLAAAQELGLELVVGDEGEALARHLGRGFLALVVTNVDLHFMR
jgi:hypothetical protein